MWEHSERKAGVLRFRVSIQGVGGVECSSSREREGSPALGQKVGVLSAAWPQPGATHGFLLEVGSSPSFLKLL